MIYNFNDPINRKNTNSVKYDLAYPIYGTNDLQQMWIADMDFKTPDFILKAIEERAKHPVLGYTFHSDTFYDSIVQWMKTRHQWEIQREWIHFAPGIVAGLSILIQAFTEVNDKVLIFTPVYNPFYNVVQNQDRSLVLSPLIYENETYHIDFEDLEKRLKDNVKIVIFCNPHNPVCRCWTPDELRKSGELCLQYGTLLISDEIHADLIMPGFKHTPFASLSPEIAANTITCMAPSKSFNMAGLSTSEVIISNPKLGKRYAEFVMDRLHVEMGNIFGDVALEAAYTHGADWMNQLNEYIFENVNFAKSFIAEKMPFVKTIKHEATYLSWMDFSDLPMSHDELWQKTIQDARIALNDGRIYGKEGEKFLRMNLACPKNDVETALLKLERAFEDYK
ncbi:MAG: PatB family C-S lyase [Bacteroidales bacterium]|jgi:cystathionine beta-lyase|nr:PatB family C-S lyase [Bacteroidales bacterium]